MAHWSDTYLGLPYQPGTRDCAALAEQVQREVFGRTVNLPKERAPGLRGQDAQIRDQAELVAALSVTPIEGDAVLMICRGTLSHVGIFCEINGTAYVLHAMKNAGQVVRHRLRHLALYGLAVQRFYTWR